MLVPLCLSTPLCFCSALLLCVATTLLTFASQASARSTVEHQTYASAAVKDAASAGASWTFQELPSFLTLASFLTPAVSALTLYKARHLIANKKQQQQKQLTSDPVPSLTQSTSPSSRTAKSFDTPSLTKSSLEHQSTVTPAPNTDSDVLIVGAGVAGASLALSLARHSPSLRITLVERSYAEPHRIVGELLQPAGVETAKALRIDDALEGFDAQTITGYGVLLKGELIHLAYPSFDQRQQQKQQKQLHQQTSSKIQVTGRSFHNGRFLMRLRHLCRQQANITMIEASVNGVVRQPDSTSTSQQQQRIIGVSYRDNETKQNITRTASLTVICDGCFSTLRNSLQPKQDPQPEQTQQQQAQPLFMTKSRFLGLILRDCPLPIENSGHCILADPTPILAYPISSTEVRVLIDFPHDVPTGEALHEDLTQRVLPQLPACMHESFTQSVARREFACMPNRSMPAHAAQRYDASPGAILLGDSLNMRHPLTGGGMTVALSDVYSLSQHLLRDVVSFADTDSLDRSMQHHYSSRCAPVKTINILADALYDVFCARHPELRSACFAYLSAPYRSAGPISLLSGMSQSQLLLCAHFFAVAFFGIGKFMLPVPSMRGALTSVKVLRQAVNIITPLFVAQNNCLPMRVFASIVRTMFWV